MQILNLNSEVETWGKNAQSLILQNVISFLGLKYALNSNSYDYRDPLLLVWTILAIPRWYIMIWLSNKSIKRLYIMIWYDYLLSN
jgi:predicted CDP-diglyceride synthetase/phosphatidate cytidylyltransferase